MILKALFERIPAVLCQGSWDTDIASIAMCSKEVTNNSLFICIKGMEQDGHQYIQEAAERGAAACLVEEAFWKKSASVHGNLKQPEKKTSAYGELKLLEQMTIVSVQNTREAAAWAAAALSLSVKGIKSDRDYRHKGKNIHNVYDPGYSGSRRV